MDFEPPDGPFTIWTILRDGRGGEAWLVREVPTHRTGVRPPPPTLLAGSLLLRKAPRYGAAAAAVLPMPAPMSVFMSSSVKYTPPPKNTSVPMLKLRPPG